MRSYAAEKRNQHERIFMSLLAGKDITCGRRVEVARVFFMSQSHLGFDPKRRVWRQIRRGLRTKYGFGGEARRFFRLASRSHDQLRFRTKTWKNGKRRSFPCTVYGLRFRKKDVWTGSKQSSTRQKDVMSMVFSSNQAGLILLQ